MGRGRAGAGYRLDGAQCGGSWRRENGLKPTACRVDQGFPDGGNGAAGRPGFSFGVGFREQPEGIGLAGVDVRCRCPLFIRG